jgi:hypothetical protein
MSDPTRTAGIHRHERRLDGWIVLATLILPFFFFDWALPFVSRTTLGNDYQLFSIRQQVEIQFSLAKGSFPLFVPGFAGGQSVQALTLGQAYHPISLIAARIPGYWSGHAEACNTLLRLLSLGVAHLVLMIFLRRLGLGRALAFVLALVTTYNLRMLDLFRYGAALESWTGHLFLCAAVGLYLLDRRSLGARAGIIASTYWLLTSGHPQMAYYGALAAGLFTLLLPFVSAAIEPTRVLNRAELVRFWAGTAGLFGLGAALSAPYGVPFATEFLSSNVRSAAGRDFAWALGWQDTLWGTLNNFFFPLRADVHGAFGGSWLPLVAVLAPVAWLARRRVPAGIAGAWLLALLVFLAMQGERTPIYKLLWHYLPLVSSVRSAGRMAMLLPILLMCVLAWVLAPPEAAPRPFRRTATLFGGIALAAFCADAVVSWLVAPGLSDYRPVGFNQVSPLTEGALWGMGAVALVVWGAQEWLVRWRRPLLALLCLCTALQTKLAIEHGTWKEPVLPTPTFAELEQLKAKELGYRFASGEGMLTLAYWRQASEFHVEPRLARIYGRWRVAADVEDAYRILSQGIAPDEVVVESPSGLDLGSGQDASPTHATVRLVHGTFNRWVFDVALSRPGLLSVSYPYTGRWTATVDGARAQLLRANGGHHGVFLPSGHHVVDLRYRSVGQTVGWIIGALGLVLAVGVLVWPVGGARLALSGAALAAAAAGAYVALQLHSLYTGQSLNSSYAWSESVLPSAPPNLAYGRRTTLSSTFQIRHNCCPFVGSKATDGDTSPRSGFLTEEEDAPVWGVDLGEARVIGSLVAFESRRGDDINRRPLLAAFSLDGRVWQPVQTPLTEDGSRLRLAPSSPITARYLAIRAGGRCRLSLDEVEVFSP